MDVLKERGKVYGSFSDNADAAQTLKATVTDKATRILSSEELEALDLIFTKIARIITGSPDHSDNWVDIAGYATLMVDISKNGMDTRAVATKFAPPVHVFGDDKK